MQRTHIYKFMNSRFLPDMLDHGRIKIGTAAEYRVDDGLGDGRSDTHEMLLRWQAPDGDYTIDNAPSEIISMFPPGGLAANGEKMTISLQGEIEFRIEGNAYLFCGSRKITRLCVRKMQELFDCDACVQISDAEWFGRCVFDRAPRLHHTDMKGVNSGEWRFGPVHYGLTDRSIPFQGSPFLKRPQYRWQQEIRYLWFGMTPMEPFVVDVPEIKPLLRVVDLAPYR